MKKIDARGLDCPEPVVKTKNALDEHREITTIVDNRIAAKNVSKLAEKMNCSVEINEESDDFQVVLRQRENNESKRVLEQKGKVYFIKSDKLGEGEAELGSVLMNGFIYTLLDVDPLPDRIIFINSGVKIPTLNEDAIDSLESLEEKGVEILSCGTCLDYYELKDQLAVGTVSNMYEILDLLNDNNVVSI